MYSLLVYRLLLLSLLSIKAVFSENILYVAAMASPSHHIWNRALAFGLAQKGYNVTHIGPDRDNLPKPQNYTHILLEGIYDSLDKAVNVNEMSSFGPARMLIEFQNWCLYNCEFSLKAKGLQTLLNYPPDFKFDLIIYNLTPGYCLFPLVQRFNYPPTVGVSAFLLPPFVSYHLGNALFPTYIPWYGLPYTAEMDFIERVWNFMYTYVDVFLRHFYQYHGEYTAAKKIFGDNIPSVEDFEKHISLVLANTDPILDHPQPMPPNIIPVGGLHTRKSEEIPQDFKKILDSAKNGVIIMSLGTNIRADKLPQDTQNAILDAFSKLSETVIWKFESNIKETPKNVIIRKWLPQNDILGHPNVKLFIGHGGTLSTQEIAYHGIPIVAIPFIIDQYINAKMIVDKRLGVQIDFKNITSEYFLTQLREVLDNPIYAENMKKLSRLYKDKPETALERGIFWIEYVLRHGSTHFLSTAGRNLPFYIRSSLDVILFLTILSGVFVLLLYKLIIVILNLFAKSKKVKTQ